MLIKLRSAFICMICLSYFTGGVLGQELIDLQRAIDISTKENVQLRQDEINISLSKLELERIRLLALPVINSSANINANLGRSLDPFTYDFINNTITANNFAIGASLPLFQGFKRSYDIVIKKAQVKKSGQNFTKDKNEIVSSVINFYLLILKSKDLLDAAKSRLLVAKMGLDVVQKQFKVGNKNNFDVAQAKAQVAEADLSVTTYTNELLLNKINLAQLMNLDDFEKFTVVEIDVKDLEDSPPRYVAEEIFEQARQHAQGIQIAKFETVMAEQNIRIAKATRYPQISLNTTVSSGFSSVGKRFDVNSSGNLVSNEASPNFQLRNNLNYSFGLSFSIPITEYYRSSNSIKSAKLQLQNSHLLEELAENNLRKTVTQALAELKSASSRYHAAKSTYISYLEAFKAMELRFKAGITSVLEFNTASNNEKKAHIDMIHSQYDCLYKKIVIDFYLNNQWKL